MKRILGAVCLVMVLALLAPGTASATCTGGACVMAGPRLASVDTSQGALTNALLGSLLGTNVNLSVLDWNSIAGANISAASFISALQTQLGVSTPAQALGANASVLQLVNAAAAAAQADGQTAAVSALNALSIPIAGLSGTVAVGNLLNVGLPSGSLTDVKINALDLVTGFVQAYNYQNVATTPNPITISGTSLGLGSVLGSIKLYAQVVEPPVIVCGTVGTQFHSSAIRVKLDINLVSLPLSGASLLGILGITAANISLAHLEVYVDVARADGTITIVDAIAKAVTVNATPGVADIYLGTISDSVFWNRSSVINVNTQLGYSTIGTLQLTVTLVGTLNANIGARSYAHGQAPFSQSLVFNGPLPQTKTASTSANFVNNLVSGLITNLQLTLTPSLGALLDAAVLSPLQGLVGTAVSPLLSTVLTGVADPLLNLVGIKLGQVVVSVMGTSLVCSVSGNVYSDANHNASRDGFEVGTGLTLYAKIFANTSPSGPALQAVTVNTSTGAYQFDNVWAANYTVLVDTNNTLSDVTPGVSSGWLGTENPTLSRNDITMTTADVTNRNFGLFNGSKLSGIVFKDSGTGGGTANNATRDGGEGVLSSVTVRITDNAGSTTYDTTATAGDGTYTLWIAAAAGATLLKVVETDPAGYLSTGGSVGTTAGSYTRATDTVTFTHAVGTVYTGVNFADVPVNTFASNGQRTVRPSTVVLYPHTFVAGTAGTISFAQDNSTNPNAARWTQLLYQDTDCNGAINGSEAQITGNISLVADQKLCVIVKTAVPENAPYNSQNLNTLTASFTYSNASPALGTTHALTELTYVVESVDSVLKLTKTVDKASAKTGDLITYQISYSNLGIETLDNLKINDKTPAYTVFTSAACGTLPSGITGCSLTQQPAVNAAGAVEWTFVGSLAPGASGTVTLIVTLQ